MFELDHSVSISFTGAAPFVLWLHFKLLFFSNICKGIDCLIKLPKVYLVILLLIYQNLSGFCNIVGDI